MNERKRDTERKRERERERGILSENSHRAFPHLQVVRIMAEELGWTAAEQRTQLEKARTFIDLEMGQEARQQVSID